MTKWISVKERLPEKNGRYLIFDPGTIRIKSFYKGVFYSTRNIMTHMSENEIDDWFKNGKKCRLTHWMPLPEPPETE